MSRHQQFTEDTEREGYSVREWTPRRNANPPRTFLDDVAPWLCIVAICALLFGCAAYWAHR